MILGLAPLTFTILVVMSALGIGLALVYGLTYKAREEDETWRVFG